MGPNAYETTIRELKKEIQFKDTLLKIKGSIAQIQDTPTLFDIIYTKVKPVFRFDYATILVLDEKQETFKVLCHSRYPKSFDTFFSQPQLLKGTPFEEIFTNDTDFTVLRSSEMLKKYPGYPGLQIAKKEGYEGEIFGKLYDGDKLIGGVEFVYKELPGITPKLQYLLKSFIPQLAVAVSNTLANEQLLREKQFKETLLGINDAVAKIQNRKELFRVVFEHIRLHIRIDDFGLVIFNDDHTQWKNLAITHDYDYEHTQSAQLYREHGYDDWMPMDSLIKRISVGTGVITAAQCAEHPDFPINEIIQATGFEEFIYTPLQAGGDHFGILILDSKSKGAYSEKDFPLFQAIADQLAVAVSNVMANERVLEEKQFKETLLEITGSVANINKGRDLVSAIFDKLQKVFPFDDAGLFAFDRENTMERDLMVDYEYSATGVNTKMSQAGITGWMPLTDLSKYLPGEGITIMDTETLYSKFQHAHFKIDEMESFQQAMFGPLKQGEEVIGALYFWSNQPRRFTREDIPIFQSIASQLSVALSNVLANEQIHKENQRKQLLLEVAQAISSARTIDVLLQQVVKTVAPIFQSQEHALILIDEENDEYKDLAVLYHEMAGSLLDTKYHEMGFYTTQKISYQGSQLQAMVKACEKENGNPICFNYNKDYSGFADRVLLEQLKLDMSEAVIALLKTAGKTYGVFMVAYTEGNHFDTEQLPIFRSVSDQLAIAVSNALANEDIYRGEKEKVLQVDLVNTLNQDIPWSTKLEKASVLLNDHVQGDLVIFAIQPDGHSEYCHTFEHIGSDQYRHFDYHALLDFVGVEEKEYQQTREMSMETILVNGKILEEYAKKDRLLAGIVKRFGIQSWLSVALKLGLPGRYRVSFLGKKNDAYGTQDKDFLLRLRPVMQLTIEKLLAYERIVHLSTQLKQEKDYLQEEVNITYDFANMIGQTQVMRQVFTQVSQVAKSDTTVLVLGETGTGKELIARALHDASPRSNKPLVKLNCAALPESLIESELFGHERGAFTGALKKRMGKFELAHKGTIFLDEIGELPLAIQAKLLRVIQEKEFEPLGSNQTIRSDFRLIVATNRNLVEEVQKGTFRMDLFYRLNAFPILLPPLRQRAEDIPLLANHYGNLFAKKLGYQYHGIVSSSLKKLQAYHWPGNIRELQNLVEQGLLIHGNRKLVLSPQTDNSAYGSANTATSLANLEINEEELDDITLQDIDAKKSQLEKAYLEAILQKTKWRISGRHGAAALLDAKAPTLESRLKKLGITRK